MEKERNDVLTSAACYAAMVALVAGLSFQFGFVTILNLYIIPYWVRLHLAYHTQTAGDDTGQHMIKLYAVVTVQLMLLRLLFCDH